VKLHDIAAAAFDTGATGHARLIIMIFGVLLCLWTVSRLGKRSLLVPLGGLFLTISLGLIGFAIIPGVFDQFAYFLGVKYPPLVYLILALIVLLALNVHLAARVSLLDVRCRRLAQDLAIHTAEKQTQKPAA
jgi:hypothetical protein